MVRIRNYSLALVALLGMVTQVSGMNSASMQSNQERSGTSLNQWANRGGAAVLLALFAYGLYKDYPVLKKKLTARTEVSKAKTAAEAQRLAAIYDNATAEQMNAADAAMDLIAAEQNGHVSYMHYEEIVMARGCAPENAFLKAVYTRVLPQLPLDSFRSTSVMRASALARSLKIILGSVVGNVLLGALNDGIRTGKPLSNAAQCASVGAVLGIIASVIAPLISSKNATRMIRNARMLTHATVIEALQNNTPETGIAALLSYGALVDTQRIDLDNASRGPLGITFRKDVTSLGRTA